MLFLGKLDTKTISIVVEVIGDYIGGKVLINGAIIFVLFIPVLLGQPILQISSRMVRFKINLFTTFIIRWSLRAICIREM